MGVAQNVPKWMVYSGKSYRWYRGTPIFRKPPGRGWGFPTISATSIANGLAKPQLFQMISQRSSEPNIKVPWKFTSKNHCHIDWYDMVWHPWFSNPCSTPNLGCAATIKYRPRGPSNLWVQSEIMVSKVGISHIIMCFGFANWKITIFRNGNS